MSGRLIRTYLRRARKRANKTQKQLCPEISISLRKYTSIEGGVVDPTAEELETIATVLGENPWTTHRSEEEFLKDRRRHRRVHRDVHRGKSAG